MVERPGENLSVRRQCALLNLARSGVYRPGPVTGADDLALMRRIDELHLKWPFYGSRRMVFELNQAGHGINRKRVQRLMRVMGIEALVPRPGTTRPRPGLPLRSMSVRYRSPRLIVKSRRGFRIVMSFDNADFSSAFNGGVLLISIRVVFG
jgi:hypothetical protein